MFHFKMAARKQILLCENISPTKIWKTTFPKEFFNEIWLKVGEYKCIYIFEIKFKKKIILLKYGGQNKFCHIAQ